MSSSPGVTKLNTIQKRNNLNDVYRADEPGVGGACHEYTIQTRVFPEGEKPALPFIKSEDTIRVGTIQFQCGPRSDIESTPGVLDCDLLEIVRDRLKAFNEGEYATEENAHALRHIEEALLWMNKRVEDRAERGVLGTMTNKKGK